MALIEETELIRKIEGDLYLDFQKTDPDAWPMIRIKIELLQTAKDILSRMGS